MNRAVGISRAYLHSQKRAVENKSNFLEQKTTHAMASSTLNSARRRRSEAKLNTNAARHGTLLGLGDLERVVHDHREVSLDTLELPIHVPGNVLPWVLAHEVLKSIG